MKYRIVTNRARDCVDLDGLDAFLAYVRGKGWHITDTDERRRVPTVKELHGPTGGDADVVRYEDWETSNLLSMD
jgi:hypothetical protein